MAASEPAPEVPPDVLEYLAAQNTLTLATASATGVPHAGTFMYANDGLTLYFWARPHSTTAKHIEQNPVVALTIDDYAEDPRQTRGVQATGECRVVLGGDEIVRALGLISEKFTGGSTGASTTNISFFRIVPSQLYFIDNTGGRGDGGSQEEFGYSYHRELAFSAFSDLPRGGSATLSAGLETVELEPGDIVVRQGGPADKFFIVLAGAVELVREEEGQPRTLAELGTGQFFGEMAIMRDSPRSATVRAVSATTLMVMERDTFRTLVAESLGLTEDFDRIVRARLDQPGAGEVE